MSEFDRLKARMEMLKRTRSGTAATDSTPQADMLSKKLTAARDLKKRGASIHLSDVRRITSLTLQYPIQSKCPRYEQAIEHWDDAPALCPDHNVKDCCPGTELDAFCRRVLLGQSYATGFRLNEIQARALREWMALAETGSPGCLGPIGVGWGKTLINYLIANYEFGTRGKRKILLWVPAQVIQQTAFTDADWARTKIPFPAPVLCLGGLPRKRRNALVRSGKAGIYVMPYSQLSGRDTVDLLRWIDPDTVLGDELHKLANFNAARTRRVSKFMDDENEKHRDFGGWSGTITRKTLADYAHLARWALGTKSPVPQVRNVLDEWSAVIDTNSSTAGSAGELAPLVEWARRHFPGEEIGDDRKGFRKAYKLRLTTCPGVAATGDSDIGTTLTMNPIELKPPSDYPGWDKLQDLILQVEDLWITPNGDEIEHAIHKYKWLSELTMGGYYRLFWPTVEAVAKKRGWSPIVAEDKIKLAQEHHDAQQNYHRLLRSWLLERQVDGLDTPFLLGSHFHLHAMNPDDHPLHRKVDPELFDLWCVMKIAEEAAGGDDIVQREREFVRVCDFRMHDAAKRAAEMLKQAKKEGIEFPGNISWFYHNEFVTWARDVYIEHGLDPLVCKAGPENNKKILNKANWNRIIISSTAHATGKNLQGMRYQQVVQWNRSASMAEQLLGRFHRVGQEADELTVHLMFMTDFDWVNFAACLLDALYQQQTTGQRQKIVFANYTVRPKIFPPEVLRERGFHDVGDVDTDSDLYRKFAGKG